MVPPASPTDSKPQHHRRLRQADFAWPINQPASNQLDAPIRPVGAYAQMGEAGGPTKVMWRLQRRFSLAARHRFFWQDKRNGVEWQQGATTTTQGNGAHAQSPDNHQAPPQSRAKMSNDHRGRSAHANGGAAEVKRRFSLAARHRFFGQAPKKWGRMAGQGNENLPTYRRTRTNVKKIGGTPREGSPMDPPQRFNKQKESSALCGARAGAPPLHPAAFEKAGETFRRARCAQARGRTFLRRGGGGRRLGRSSGTR